MSAEGTTPEGVPGLQRTVRPLCSSCRFPLDEYTAGLRHFGTHTAHAEWYCIQRLCNEVDRLSATNAAVALAILRNDRDEAVKWAKGLVLPESGGVEIAA